MSARKEIDTDIVFDLAQTGHTQAQIAGEIGMSAQTLSKRMAEIRQKQGLLMQYRQLQNLQLTELQARMLEAVTPERIAEASLTEVVRAFKILKDAELNVKDDTGKVTGLLGHLLRIEKEDLALRRKIDKLEGDIPDGELVVLETEPDIEVDENGDELPRL